MNPSGRGIDVHFDDCRRVRVGRRRSHASALEPGSRSRRRVRAGRPNRAECCLGELHGFRERDTDRWVLGIEHAAIGEHEPVFRDRELARHGVCQKVSRALGGLDGRVAHHQRHAARVRAEIDRRQIGVARDGADVDWIDAEDFRHAGDQDIVRALTDFGGAAERGDAAAAIELQLHAGMRHVVPVDREPCARQIRRTGQSDAASERQPAMLRRPVGRARDAADAFGETDGAQAQIVGRQRFRLFDDAQAKVCGVEAERVGNLVELNLLAETALRRAMASLRPAGRLVREHAATLKPVRRDVVRDRLQRAGVERARDAVRSIRAAVENGLHFHPGDRAVVVHSGLHPHQHRMATAMAVEHLFAREADLHGTVEQPRRLCDHNLVVEGIALAAEAAAVGSRDDSDMRGRHVERLRERPVDVVRRLRARPEHELAVGILRRHCGMLLDRQVRIALIEERVLEHLVCIGERASDVSEFERDELVDVAAIAVLVDARVVVLQAVFGRRERPQRFVLDVDQIERFERSQLVACDDGSDRIADEANAIDGERVLVLAHGEDAVRNREVAAVQDEEHARVGARARRVDADNARVRRRGSQELTVHHARQHDVVGELRLTGRLRAAVDAAAGFADDIHFLISRGTPPFSHRGGTHPRRGCSAPSRLATAQGCHAPTRSRCKPLAPS